MTSKVKHFFIQNGPWLGLFLLIALMGFMTDGGFLSPRNLTNLVRQASINGVLATGMTLVILSSGIDLSIGSIVALCGIVVGMSQVNFGFSELGTPGVFYSLVASVVVGVVLGFLNGGLISLLKIPPFVITLGMMVIARGIALILSQGGGISPMSESFRVLGEGYFEGPLHFVLIAVLFVPVLFLLIHRRFLDALFPLVASLLFSYAFTSYKGFPVPALFLLGVVFSFGFLLRYTVFGRSVFAIGSNETAAFWAGVSITKIKWLIYILMGFLSGLAGALLTARLNSAVPTAGELFELDAIASVVIGGTSLKGGVGSVQGSLVGALIIATLNNGMDLMGVPSFYQMVFKGIVIITAVALDRGRKE